jgi:hypothetical protein
MICPRLDQAHHFRARAEYLRAEAEKITDIGMRNRLLRLADAYDEAAERAKRAATRDDADG